LSWHISCVCVESIPVPAKLSDATEALSGSTSPRRRRPLHWRSVEPDLGAICNERGNARDWGGDERGDQWIRSLASVHGVPCRVNIPEHRPRARDGVPSHEIRPLGSIPSSRTRRAVVSDAGEFGSPPHDRLVAVDVFDPSEVSNSNNNRSTVRLICLTRRNVRNQHNGMSRVSISSSPTVWRVPPLSAVWLE